MTEKRIDSHGPSLLIRGKEKEWRLMQNRFGLMDAFNILGGAPRSHFTRRGCNMVLDLISLGLTEFIALRRVDGHFNLSGLDMCKIVPSRIMTLFAFLC